MLDTARDIRKTLKKWEEKRKMRKKSQATTNIFLLLLSYRKKCVLLENIFGKNLVYIVTLVLQFSRVAGCWKCSNKQQRPYKCTLVL